MIKAAKKLESPNNTSLFELLFYEANDPIFTVDLKHNTIMAANSKIAELTGYTRLELEGSPTSLIYPEDTSDAKVQNLRTVPLQDYMLHEGGFYEDLTLRKKDGYLAYVSLSIRSIESSEVYDYPISICIARDTFEKKKMERDLITKHTELKKAYLNLERTHMELKTAQEALVQSGKLAALGELSAGVAHEVNQPLTGVLGFAQELKNLLQDNPIDIEKTLKYANEIEKNAIRMSKIIKQLREFTRKSTEDYSFVDVEPVIQESFNLLQAQFKSRGIDVQVTKDADLPKIYCNPFQLEQVFINLATNSRDAIEQKGESSGRITVDIQKDNDQFIKVIYSDNGCGMNSLTKKKAMQPFFTTKEVGKGTGLGLSVSFGILSQIHASMMVESKPGKGATFQIKLPIDYRNLEEHEGVKYE